MSTTISMNPVEYCFDFTDPATVRGSTSSENQSALRPIVNEYFVNDDTISNSFGQRLDPLLADWIDVALATYIADRLSLRRDTSRLQHAFNWSRIFRLKIPVRNLKAWQREEVQNALRTLLRFLTDDDWNIEFVAKSGLARTAETKEYLFPMPLRPPVHVALFSGGLDSFAGAANQIHVLSEHSFVFVSGATNSRHKYAQREQIRVIGREARQEVCHVVIPFGFNWHGRGHETIQETTQRTRGFVFLTLGAVTALTAGASELRYENGLGAINLPYDATQLGTANSRGVHPLTLLLMAELAEHLIGRSFKVENPYLFQTKAEMCNSELTKVLAKHFNLTFSCDGFPVRTHGKPQCGSCTSCLLRRLSLERSGLSIYDPGDQYIVDLLRSDTTASDKQLRHLRAMEWQFQRISLLLKKSDPWQAMAVQFPELQTLGCEISLRTTTNADTFQQSIVRLYSRYISEWQTFSARNSLQRRARAA